MNQRMDTSAFAVRPISWAAESRYRQILETNGSLELPLAEADHDAELTELVECGLLAPLDAREADPPMRVFTAVDPKLAQPRWTAKLNETAIEQFGALSATDVGADRLTESYDRHIPGIASEAGFHQVIGKRAINQRIGQIVAGCTRELLTLQPGTRPPAAVHSALRRDLDASRRVAWKTLYEPGVQTDEALHVYVKTLSQAGAQFRTSARLTHRLLIVDLNTAVVPAPSINGETAACFITDPPCVAYLRRVFQRQWRQASPWRSGEGSVTLTELQRHIAQLLLAGLEQADMAAELRMNERTLAGHIAQMKAQLGASTLFQLGAALNRNERP